MSGIRTSPKPSPTTTPHIYTANFQLTEDERQIIERTWRQLAVEGSNEDVNDIGVRVFTRIFQLAPDVKSAFPMFGNLETPEQMSKNVMFRCHGKRFFRAVQSVVEHLDSLDVFVVPNLNVLGRQHRHFDGFEPRYLATFETAMEEVWKEVLGRAFDQRARKAWRKVFKLITSTVQRGYEDGPSCGGSTAKASPSTDSDTGVVSVNGDVTLVPTEAVPDT